MTEQKLNMKIVERVRKLLALAEDGGATEAEAQLAAEKARELMAEHGLSTATVEAHGGQGEARAKVELQGKADKWWQPPLMEAICETCFVFVERKYRNDRAGRTLGAGYRMIGRESGVATAQVLFDYLCATVERATREHTVKLEKPKWFQRAMSERLQERIKERHEQAMQQQAKQARQANAAARHPASAGTALVVVLEDYAQKERDLNEDARRGKQPGTTAREREEYEHRQLQRQQAYQQRHAEALAMGLTEDEAYYYAAGYSVERAKELATPVTEKKEETEAQRRKREEADERYRERYYRQRRFEENKRSSASWRAGREAGEKVGLDPQVGGSGTKKLGG
jgi:hypothetical protein